MSFTDPTPAEVDPEGEPFTLWANKDGATAYDYGDWIGVDDGDKPLLTSDLLAIAKVAHDMGHTEVQCEGGMIAFVVPKGNN